MWCCLCALPIVLSLSHKHTHKHNHVHFHLSQNTLGKTSQATLETNCTGPLSDAEIQRGEKENWRKKKAGASTYRKLPQL